ncbi:MAG: hypothetical protein DWC01_03600 [Candidatus Poseidoniales archaeon]|nr:MAG: hypothetical protein DWC01_03600 [Candidatus Poseidoniales archaeon]
MTAQVLTWALNQLNERRKVVLATVLTTSGSVPGKTGARLAMRADDGKWRGTIGGAGLEHRVLQRCRALLQSAKKPEAELLTYGLNKGAKGYEVTPLDSLCGGRVTIAVEVMIPMPHVFIMGGGHCGEAIVGLLDQLAWSYSVHDTREEFSSDQLYPRAVKCITSTVSDLMASENANTLNRFSDILLLGHDWAEDQERLLSLLSIFNDAGYQMDGEQAPRIGVIGSRSKWQSFEQEALREGIPQHLLDQVICPIGINIGAESPEEIAVAVVAQILSSHKGVLPDQPTWRQSS